MLCSSYSPHPPAGLGSLGKRSYTRLCCSRSLYTLAYVAHVVYMYLTSNMLWSYAFAIWLYDCVTSTISSHPVMNDWGVLLPLERGILTPSIRLGACQLAVCAPKERAALRQTRWLAMPPCHRLGLLWSISVASHTWRSEGWYSGKWRMRCGRQMLWSPTCLDYKAPNLLTICRTDCW